jgi:hypothetical protein
LLGIDFSDQNIAKAKENYVGRCDFVCGDMLDIKKIIDETNTINKREIYIFTALGSMTRMVLPNGFIAVKILTDLISIPNTFALLGGGMREPLFSNYMLKQIGFEIIKNSAKDENFFYLVRSSQKKIIEHKLKKLENENKLDLSFFPNILTWFKPGKTRKKLEAILLLKNKKNVFINLSYNEVDETLFKYIQDFSVKYNIHWVMNHWDATIIKNFRDLLVKGFFNTRTVTTKKIKYDRYLLSHYSFINTLCPLKSIQSKLNQIEKFKILYPNTQYWEKSLTDFMPQLRLEELCMLPNLLDFFARLINLTVNNNYYIETLIQQIGECFYRGNHSLQLKFLEKIMTQAFNENKLSILQCTPNDEGKLTARKLNQIIQTQEFIQGPILDTTITIIDSNCIQFYKQGSRGRSNGFWVKIGGRDFFQKEDTKPAEITNFSSSHSNYMQIYTPDSMIKKLEIITACKEVLATKIFNTYLLQGTPNTILTFNSDQIASVLSEKVEECNILDYSHDLCTIKKLFYLLLATLMIGDDDCTVQNFMSSGKNLKRIDLGFSFTMEKRFDINLLNPFKLIQEIGYRKGEEIIFIADRFYPTLLNHYQECLAFILEVLTHFKHNIMNPFYRESRSKLLNHSKYFLAIEDVMYIANFLTRREEDFLHFLENLNNYPENIFYQLFPKEMNELSKVSQGVDIEIYQTKLVSDHVYLEDNLLSFYKSIFSLPKNSVSSQNDESLRYRNFL